MRNAETVLGVLREVLGDQPGWAVLMTDKRRKALVVCEACHEDIHPATSTAQLTQ